MGTEPTIHLGATAPLEIREVGVMIEGHELVSKKLIDIVTHILVNNEVQEYDCINSIIFSADLPEDKYGHYDTDTKNITINLQKQFVFAVETVKEDAELAYLSLRGHIWYGLLRTILHEICHAMAFAIDPETMLGEDREAIEESIDEESAGHLSNLVRDYDMEPPEMADEPFFGPRYMEFHVKSIKENAEQWAINLDKSHATGFIWVHDDAVCNTFREWFRASYNFEGDDAWDKDPSPLIGAYINIVEEKVEAQVDTVEDKPAEAVEIEVQVSDVDETSKELVDIVQETVAEPIALTNEVEPLTGIDAETMALLHMDDPDSVEVVVQEPTVVVEPAPAVKLYAEGPGIGEPVPVPELVQQELPLKVETASELCRSCNIVLTADAKFCASCGTSIVATPMPALPSAPLEVATVAHPQAAPQPAQFSSGARREMRHDLPDHGHTAEQIRACVGEVLSRCYSHIFSKCGFLPGLNPSFAPELRNAIQEPVSVVGVPCVDQILIGMDSIDPLNGAFTWCVPAIGSMVRGKTTKNQGMPSYTLYFNFNGHEAKRLIIPQNQWKVSADGTQYSGPAQRAQQGAMIVWLIDGDDSTAGKKWRAKIENGSLEWMI